MQNQRELWNTPLIWQRVYASDGKEREPTVEVACVPLHTSLSENLTVHCGKCDSKPSMCHLQILGRARKKVDREIIEALFIVQKVRKRASARSRFSRQAMSLNTTRRHDVVKKSYIARVA